MLKQAYNLLWLSLKIKSEQDSSKSFQLPLSEDKLENLKRIAKENPDTEVRLWIDSKRLTKEQFAWFNDLTQLVELGNLSIQDLRAVKDYTDKEIFNKSETSSFWGKNKNSLIWRQVDLAKLLICLQGDYDRVFYSDMDDVLNINSEEVKKSMTENGFVVGGVFHEDRRPGVENQAFGFDKTRLNDFRHLFDVTEGRAVQGENGYVVFGDMVRKWVKGETELVAVHKEHVGVSAWHPDEEGEMKHGMGNWR